MPDPVKGDLDKTVAGFRRSLLQKERGAASQMVRYYGEAWQRIRKEIVSLVAEYERLVRTGQDSQATLFQIRRMREIKSQVEKELAKFARYAGNTIQRQEAEAIRAASRDALRLVQGSFWPAPSVDMAFNKLSPSAIENMIATFQAGSPVHDRLGMLAGEGAQAVQDGLTQGLMLGQNANTIARQIRLALGNSLAKALTWSRTETMRAYRGASLATYQANANVLGGWMWRSARNTRTCAMCWAMDGTIHGLSEPLDDHPNGRCFAVPVPKTWEELGISGMPPARPPRMTGSEAFARLSEAEKLKVLGPAKYAAYKDGAIKLEDLVGRRFDPRWGSMRYEKSLAELGIDWKKYAGVSIAPAAGATAPDLLAIARPAADELALLVGTPQRWSGTIRSVGMRAAPDYLGMYDPIDNSIEIRIDARNNTIIHELLHGHSAGLNLDDYMDNRGWEEGVVEKLQRLLGPEVLGKIGQTPIMGTSSYNYYVSPLQKLAAKTKMSERDFFLRMIRTPLRDRAAEAVKALVEAGYTEERALRAIGRYRKFLER